MAGFATRCWQGMILLAALLVVPSASQAQSFAFSVGSGGGHHHGHQPYHHGGWSFAYGGGPWWGPAWYGPPPIVYAPPPVVQPVVIQPQYLPASPPVTSPYTSAAPPGNAVASNVPASSSPAASIAPSLAGASANDDRIVIRNAASAQLPVSFLVDGQDIELTDGSTRTFVGKAHRTVQYDRGGRFGSTQQDLTGGQYEFRITATGWDLVRRPDLVPASRTAVRSNSLPDANVR